MPREPIPAPVRLGAEDTSESADTTPSAVATGADDAVEPARAAEWACGGSPLLKGTASASAFLEADPPHRLSRDATHTHRPAWAVRRDPRSRVSAPERWRSVGLLVGSAKSK